ncbi:ataxin-7-like protein 3, partial [Cricetulus griseus]|uniref:ataxin-7-like protein 3 n=1 Tax=Cricetulus griseus TaxID=10029 RepID=UPI0015C329F7
ATIWGFTTDSFPVPPASAPPEFLKSFPALSGSDHSVPTRSLRCPQHTDEQRRTVRIYFLGPSAVLPEVESSLDNDSFDMTDSQALISRLQWDGSSDLSPSDSGSSKTSENQGWGLGTNTSESRKTKKKKSHLSLVGTASGLGSNKKKKPKPPAPPTPSIYDDIN